MSGSKHTPGQWEAGRNSAFWEVDIQDGFSVAYVWGNDEKQAEANARLIAAAPELLAISRMIVDAKWTPEDEWPEIEVAANAAIAKATGQ